MLDKINNITQQQPLPGQEIKMDPHPIDEDETYQGSDKLKDKVAIITGGDSGIGRAIAILFAKEGANVVISYLCEDADANLTKQKVESLGKKCLLIAGDIANPSHCQAIVEKTMQNFGKLDILINHAGEQYETNDLQDITPESLDRIFKVNIYSMIFLTTAAFAHLKTGASIINTTSVVAYKGNPLLLDYTATKGAVLSFTRALAIFAAPQGIRVNAVAPGPIWTPLIPASFSPDHLAKFGQDTLLKRPGQPYEVAPAYLYLASNLLSSYVTGQVIHVNGGLMVGS